MVTRAELLEMLPPDSCFVCLNGIVKPIVLDVGVLILMCDDAEEVWLHSDDFEARLSPVFLSQWAPGERRAWKIGDTGLRFAPGAWRDATTADLDELPWARTFLERGLSLDEEE